MVLPELVWCIYGFTIISYGYLHVALISYVYNDFEFLDIRSFAFIKFSRIIYGSAFCPWIHHSHYYERFFT